jgi:hypothetical protein
MKEGSMLKNATYNLVETATVISKGLHRYDQILPHLKSHFEHEGGSREAGKRSAA